MHMSVFVCMYAIICMCICMCVHVSAYMHICGYVCMHTNVYYVYWYVDACGCAHVCMYAHLCACLTLSLPLEQYVLTLSISRGPGTYQATIKVGCVLGVSQW